MDFLGVVDGTEDKKVLAEVTRKGSRAIQFHNTSIVSA